MPQQQTDSVGEHSAKLPLRFPSTKLALDQHEEWCEVCLDGQWQRIRFHDYDQIYGIPGLYETLFARHLKCCSPQRVVGLLDEVLSDFPQSIEEIRVLDMGAGNGMVGAELRQAGVETIHGIDILPEARLAALRDRPAVYTDYHVLDLTQGERPEFEAIRAAKLTALTLVAALGYGDIPPTAFVQACNLIESPGWLAFNIKEDFLDEDEDGTGFCSLIRRLRKHDYIQVQAYRRYQHRLSLDGEPLHYIAMVATKLRSIPLSMLR